jgi:PAS domain S-box-containing protein
VPPATSGPGILFEHPELLYRFTNDIILLLDERLDVIDCNERALEAYGYTREELLRLNLADLRGTDQQITLDDLGERDFHSEGVILESTNFRKDGSTFPVEASIRAVENGTYVLSIIRDISRRKRAETAHHDSEERFERALEKIPDVVVIYDSDLRIRFINAATERVTGRPTSDYIGKLDTEVWPPEVCDVYLPTLQAALASKTSHFIEADLSMPNVGVRHLRITCVPLLDEEGEVREILGITHDTTERKQAEDDVRRHVRQLSRVVEGSILAIGQTVELRDPYTAGHERRTAALATAIGEKLGMRGDELEGLRLAALVHDVGKIAVPTEVLSKPLKLSAIEFAIIKQHPQAGHDILAPIEFGQPIARIVLQHHERLDGSGYPQGLGADAIRPEALILAVADVVEAMSSHRPYRPARGIEAALAEIADNRGTLYAADVADTCCVLCHEEGFVFPDV